MPQVSCDSPADFDISPNEEKDYNVSFADFLEKQGGITITNYTVTTSPEMSFRGAQLKNFSRDVVVVVTGDKPNSRGWVTVLVETNKNLPMGRVHKKEVTLVFRIPEQNVAQNSLTTG